MDIEKELRENPKAFEKVDYETYKEHVIVRNDSYRPFSDDWKNSLMELTKEQLIEQLKNNIIENMQLKETQITKGGQVDLLVKPTLAGDLQIIYGYDRLGNMAKPKFIRDRSGMLFEFKDITKYDGQIDRYVEELEQQQILAKYLLEQLSKCSL